MAENSKENNLQQVTGTVTEALPNAMFRVMIDGTKEENISYLSGKMRKNRIKVLIGDRVEITLDSYGSKGRIVKRF